MQSRNAIAIVDHLWGLPSDDIQYLFKIVCMKAIIAKMEEEKGFEPSGHWDTEKLFSDMETALLACYQEALKQSE
jgi:hypothetical protein